MCARTSRPLHGSTDADTPRMHPTDPEGFAPPTDVVETEDKYEIRVEIAGVDPEQVEVLVGADDRTVSFTGRRRAFPPAPQVRLLNLEIAYGPFARIIHLPLPVDRDATRAAYEAGMLVVTLPKLDRKARSRSVAVSGPEDD